MLADEDATLTGGYEDTTQLENSPNLSDSDEKTLKNEIDDESINLSTLESSFNDKMTELVTDAVLSAPAIVTHKHGKHHSN